MKSTAALGCWLSVSLLALQLVPTSARASPILVPFEDDYGVATVSVLVNGQGPFSFALDTGSPGMVVTPDLAAELHLVAESSRIEDGSGTGGARSDVQTQLHSVAIGDLVETDLTATELELPRGLEHRSVGLHIRGLVGCDFLRKYVTTIDYRHLTLAMAAPSLFVRPRRSVTTKMYMVAGGGVPGIRASVDGREGTFLVDSADSGWTVIKHAFARTSGLDAIYAKGVTTESEATGGAEPERTVCLRSLVIGTGLHLRPAPAYINEEDYGVDLWRNFDGVMGYELLRRARTTLDFGRRVVIFEPTGRIDASDYATPSRCLPHTVWTL
jgi:predicted aspartyl protease